MQGTTSTSQVPVQLQPMTTTSANGIASRTIDWKKSPATEPAGWFDITSNRKFFSNILLGCTLPSAAATTYVAFRFVARPIVIIRTFSGLSLLTLALFVSGIILRRLSPSKKCPEWIQQQRQEVENKLKDKVPAYSEINYDPSVLSEEEVQILIEGDIRAMTYDDLIRKHKISVLDFLDHSNKNLLKPKYMASLIEKKDSRGIQEIANDSASKALKVSYKKIARLFAHEKVLEFSQNQNTITYSQFIEKNGRKMISCLSEQYGRWLAQKFYEHAILNIGDKGTIEAEKMYAEDFIAFGDEIKHLVLKKIIDDSYMKELSASSFDYDRFRSKNHLVYMLEFYPTAKEYLASVHLELPYRLMKKYELDRGKLGVDLVGIRTSLEKRWSKVVIQDILADKQEEKDFFDAITDNIFPASQWTRKVAENTLNMTIQQILAKYLKLFTLKILLPTTVLENEMTVEVKLKKEIEGFHSFEGIVDNFPECTFSLFSLNFTLASFTLTYAKRHPEEFLSSDLSNDYIKIIKKYKLLPPTIGGLIEGTKKLIKEEVSRYQEEISSLDSQYGKKKETRRTEKEEAIKKLREHCQLDEYISKTSETRATVKLYQEKERDFTQQLNQLRNEISQVERQKEEIAVQNQKQIIAREKAKGALYTDTKLQQVQGRRTQLEREVKQLEEQITLALQRDSTLIEIEKRLEIIKGQIQCKKYHLLEKQVKDLQNEKIIINAEIKKEENVQGIVAAVSVYRNSSEKQKRLGEINAEETELAKMKSSLTQVIIKLTEEQKEAAKKVSLVVLEQNLQAKYEELEVRKLEFRKPINEKKYQLQEIEGELDKQSQYEKSFEEANREMESLEKKKEECEQKLDPKISGSLTARFDSMKRELTELQANRRTAEAELGFAEKLLNRQNKIFEEKKAEKEKKYTEWETQMMVELEQGKAELHRKHEVNLVQLNENYQQELSSKTTKDCFLTL